MQRTAVRRTLNHVGDTITHHTADATITLQWVRPGVYSVTTYTGPTRIEQHCASKPTEAEARAFARQVAEHYSQPRTATPAPIAQAPAVSPLAALAALGTRRQIRPTHAGAQLADTTIAGWIALAIADRNGRVERGGKAGQAQVKTLTALARKGFLTLTAKPGTRATNWAYGEITPAGRRELERIRTQRATAAQLADALARIGVTQ